MAPPPLAIIAGIAYLHINIMLSTLRANMLRHSRRYLPILTRAADVQSVWLTRAVDAYARDYDARPTVVTEHGFGCWSVLGGKIVTTVANA